MASPGTARAQDLTIDELAQEAPLGPIGIFGSASFDNAALTAAGRVIFLGEETQARPRGLYLVGAAAPGYLPLPATYTNFASLQANDDHIVFVADRAGSHRGVYRVPLSAFTGTSLPPPGYEAPLTVTFIEVVFELPLGNSFDPRVRAVALSPAGTVAFTSIVNGQGAIYRGAVTGPVSPLRQGSGTFFNNRTIAVNDAGQVSVEMEYADPAQGLSRGVLVFSEPNQAITDVPFAIEKLSVGIQARHLIAADGRVLVALDREANLAALGMTIGPGLYWSTPTPLGEAPLLVSVADASASGDFEFTSRFRVAAAGRVAFQGARRDNGTSGIFYYDGAAVGAAPLVEFGSLTNGRRLSFLSLIGLNDDGALALFISDFLGPDRYIWMVNGFAAPVAPPPASPSVVSFSCAPGERAVCNWMGACHAQGSGCVCDDPMHWWSIDACSVWHAGPPLQAGQLCVPGDRAYCNWMGRCDGSGMACLCDDPGHWSAQDRCAQWHPVNP